MRNFAATHESIWSGKSDKFTAFVSDALSSMQIHSWYAVLYLWACDELELFLDRAFISTFILTSELGLALTGRNRSQDVLVN